MVLVALLMLVASVQVPLPAESCSCAAEGPPCDGFWRADAVFSGTVIEVGTEARPPAPAPRAAAPGAPAPPPPPFAWLPTRVVLRTDQVWRGEAAGDTVVYTGRGDFQCGFAFEVGQKYVVYATLRNGQLQTSRCSRTRKIDDADEDLEYFDELKRPAFGGRIIGQATLGDAPAANYRVSIGNESGTWATQTDARGHFEFAGRAPGRYAIRIDVPEEHRVASGATLLHLRDARGCAFTKYELVADGLVALTVLDQAGKPAVRTTLELIDADSLREDHIRSRPQRTNADGSVAWARVPPGRYVIGMNVTTLSNPSRSAMRLFYPGVTDVASAHTFVVGEGERVQLDTLRLPAPPPQVSVTGIVRRPDGTPLPAADVILRSAEEFSRGHLVGRPVRTDAEGRFTVLTTPGEHYFVDVWLGVEGELKERYAQSEDFQARAGMKPMVLEGSRPGR